jgi:hypothetical protein
LSATILLAYTLTGLIRVPARQFAAQLPGFYLEIQVNIQTVVSLLVITLAVSGTDWLIQEQPAVQAHPRFQHWLLPALTAWVFGIPLYQGSLGTYWWLGILAGGGALMLVLTAEYVVADEKNPYHAIAAVGLTAVAFALFFLLTITLRAMGLRLYLIVPALALTAALISLRTLSLWMQGPWAILASGICAVIVAQLVAAAHYLPFSPVSYGLFLLGPAYGLTVFLGNLGVGKPQRGAVIEFIALLLVFWMPVWWLR